jgi:TolB protein
VTNQAASDESISTPGLTQTVGTAELPPAVTEDLRPDFEGTIAFYSDMAGNPDIYVVQADGSGLTQLTDDPAFDDSPDLSPDGKRVVFLSARNDPDPQFPDLKYDIYVINVDGTGFMQLTATEVGEDHPSWSPDGSRVLFDADYDGDGFYGIYSLAADGADLVRLTTGAQNDQFGDWSPDGEQIAFSSDRTGNWDIFVMNADGSEVVPLTNDEDWQLFPAWSPDGQRIAYTGLTQGSRNTDVFVMSKSGSDVVQLTSESGFDENPSWSPDGEWIAYQHQKSGNFELYVVNPDSLDNLQLFSFPFDDLWPSWGIPADSLSTGPD